jgi:asparagine synthase (glutamine-hydrolysing)
MCGIAGWIGPDRDWNAEFFREGLRRRGPDGSGVWRGNGATLVHTRLAILGLGDAGAQPMEIGKAEKRKRGNAEIEAYPALESGDRGGKDARREDEKLTFFATDGGAAATPRTRDKEQRTKDGAAGALVFNGEIYNYRELRAELEAEGAAFAGGSDTEVLLRLLEREGEACLPRLAGMFAFCYYDETSDEALLARDAFGIKPLYYRIDGETLAFASTASLLRRPGDQIDAAAVEDTLRWGSVPEPATLHREIRLLPAGGVLRWRAGGAVEGRWAPSAPSRVEGRVNGSRFGSTAGIVRAALLESIGRHLVSEVPVGIFLSGGIDSTAVLALAREVLGAEADLRTFSIGFDDPAYDESATARRTAAHFGARHTEWRMTEAEGRAEIPAFLEAMDQPTLDGFNTWCVSRLAAREGMKVVLSGLGGDEWFAGYGSFERVPLFHAWHRRLGTARGLATGLLGLAPAGSRWRRLGEFFASPGGWLDAFHAQRGVFTRAEARELARRVCGEAAERPLFAGMEWAPRGGTPSEEVSALELGRYMRNQLLRDSDVFSMAHGLELRVPFVDVRLAEALESLPPEERLRFGKALLLEAVPEVPAWVHEQPKRGFRFPFEGWVEGGFGSFLEEAEEMAPFRLGAWYRRWTLAVTKNSLPTFRR